jgi:hypothetical protein
MEMEPDFALPAAKAKANAECKGFKKASISRCNRASDAWSRGPSLPYRRVRSVDDRDALAVENAVPIAFADAWGRRARSSIDASTRGRRPHRPPARPPAPRRERPPPLASPEIAGATDEDLERWARELRDQLGHA